jgi:hypothetical protein
MKSMNENTTLIFKLSGLKLLNCNIDWKVFSEASFSSYNSEKNICIFYNKTYNLKSLPDDFFDILNKSKKSIWKIELNTLLDIDYINITKKLAFATGTHQRLGKESLVFLLNENVLQLILNIYYN